MAPNRKGLRYVLRSTRRRGPTGSWQHAQRCFRDGLFFCGVRRRQVWQPGRPEGGDLRPGSDERVVDDGGRASKPSPFVRHACRHLHARTSGRVVFGRHDHLFQHVGHRVCPRSDGLYSTRDHFRLGLSVGSKPFLEAFNTGLRHVQTGADESVVFRSACRAELDHRFAAPFWEAQLGGNFPALEAQTSSLRTIKGAG